MIDNEWRTYGGLTADREASLNAETRDRSHSSRKKKGQVAYRADEQ